MIYPPLFFLSFTWIQLKITNKQNQLVTSNIFSFKSKTPFIITLPNLKETKARISQKKKEVKHLSFILPLSLLGAATSWTQSEGNQPVRPFTVPSQYPPSPTLMTDRHILKYKYYHIIDFGGKAFFFNMLHHKKCFFLSSCTLAKCPHLWLCPLCLWRALGLHWQSGSAWPHTLSPARRCTSASLERYRCSLRWHYTETAFTKAWHNIQTNNYVQSHCCHFVTESCIPVMDAAVWVCQTRHFMLLV